MGGAELAPGVDLRLGHRLGGFQLVVLEQAILMAVLAWLIVRLARAGSPLRTALAGVAAVGMGAPSGRRGRCSSASSAWR